MEIWDTLVKGGPIVFVIILTSILGLTVFIERFWVTRLSAVAPQSLGNALIDLIRGNRLDAAGALASQSKTPLARVFSAALADFSGPREYLKERLSDVGSMELRQLQKGLGVLSTVATVSPLLGLLGTVTGMVKVFQTVASSVDPRISDLAGGIWEALLTTVAGLVVAIPTYLAYRWLNSRIDRAADQLSLFSDEILQIHNKKQ